MKTPLALVGLCLVLIGSTHTPLFAATVSAPAKSVQSPELNAKIASLKKQQADLEAQITRLKVNIKGIADKRAVERVKDKLDALSEMGELEGLRLQMAMDRLSKLMATLEALLKKQAETQSGIVENIK